MKLYLMIKVKEREVGLTGRGLCLIPKGKKLSLLK